MCTHTFIETVLKNVGFKSAKCNFHKDTLMTLNGAERIVACPKTFLHALIQSERAGAVCKGPTGSRDGALHTSS